MWEEILTHTLTQLCHFKDEKGHSQSDHFLMHHIGSLATLPSPRLSYTSCKRFHIVSRGVPWEVNSMFYFSGLFSSSQSENHDLS